MIPNNNLIPVCALALSLFSACSKEQDDFRPSLEGDIIGYAYCFSEFGQYLEDFSGISVYTEPGRKYHAITDADGRYVLKDVINGTYDLSFEKEGFGTMKLQGIEHLGGKSTVMKYYYGDQAPFIYQNITTEISDMYVENDTLQMSVLYAGQSNTINLLIRCYFSAEENFDPGSATVIKDQSMLNLGKEYMTSLSSQSKGLPFEPGETVYFKACIYTSTPTIRLYNYYYISGIDTYYDYNTNTLIYPNLSHESEEFSFTMP